MNLLVLNVNFSVSSPPEIISIDISCQTCNHHHQTCNVLYYFFCSHGYAFTNESLPVTTKFFFFSLLVVKSMAEVVRHVRFRCVLGMWNVRMEKMGCRLV